MANFQTMCIITRKPQRPDLGIPKSILLIIKRNLRSVFIIMKFLTVLCFFGIISYAEAISCHICSGLTECAESETESETDCSDVKSTNEENGIFEQDAHMCRIDWQRK